MKRRYIVIIFFWVAASSIAATAQSQDQNYIIMSSLNKTIQYFDGLGRKTQTAIGGYESGNWLNTTQEYDKVGNIRKIWAPIIEPSGPDYVPIDNLQNETERLYDDGHGYSEIKYDCMGREMFVSQPGEKWSKKGKTKTYRVNTSSEVKKYSPSNMTEFDFFEPNALSCVIEEDEDHHKSAIFKDFLGRTILERKFADKWIDTYYVYNSLNQLTYVLQPMYQENPDLNKYAFKYTYDVHGRVKTKTLPGCAPIEYWYDDDNHVIQMQDGELKKHDKIRKYKYDDNARMIEQSIWSLNVDEQLDHIEIINFYDSYTFLDSLFSVNSIPQSVKNIEAFCSNSCSAPIDNPNGCLTGSIQYTNSGKFILSVNYYDLYYQLTKNFELGLDNNIIFNELSIGQGRIEIAETRYYKYGNNNYDQDRLTSSILTVQAGDYCRTDTIQNLTYDDFGRVIANNRSGTSGDMTYEYDNLHGWLKQMGSASGFTQSLFRETGSNNPCWNGSISAMTWKVGDGKQHTYQYTYDGLNRLTEAVYSSPKSLRELLEEQKGAGQSPVFEDKDPKVLIPILSLDGNYSVSYTYDKNCNIEWLQRNGTANSAKGKTIDALEYSYSGNQLKNVTDYSDEKLNYAGAFDFQDNADVAEEYSYNENGAMTKDLNKGITDIEYDLLGNPRKVTFSDKNSIEYVYAADGRKLRTVHSTAIKGRTFPPPIKPGGKRPPKQETIYICDTTDFINNYVFKNGKPEMYRFNGGYYSFDAEGKMDGLHLYVQDYQGNNRMVVNANTDSIEQISHYYPYGALMGDISTQPEKQSFKYSGKELDRTYGLDLYDFEARQQDPVSVCFTCVDPMAEKYYGISPYAYCVGDPINCIDPDGRDARIFIDGNNITISASVVLTGQYATQELADLYKQGIMEQWGAISSFTAIDGTEYSVTWNIDVSVNNDIDLDAGDIPKQDGYHNYMQVMCEEYSNGKHVAQSGLNIRTGYTGHVRSYSREGLSLYFDNPMPHEFGHMLGLIDRYYGNKNIRKGPQAYGNVLPGWEGHVMGEKPVDGMAYPSDLNGVVNAAICKIKMRQILWPSAKTTNLGNKYYKEKL